MSSSTYYYKTSPKQCADVSPKKSNAKPRGFCYTLFGKKIPDEFVIQKLKEIKPNLNPFNAEIYLKTIGASKLCTYFKKEYGIITNHKKMRQLKHEVGLVGKYINPSHHPRRRPKTHIKTAPNQYWEIDIKYF